MKKINQEAIAKANYNALKEENAGLLKCIKGKNLPELTKAFHAAIDDYEKSCQEVEKSLNSDHQRNKKLQAEIQGKK